MEQDLCRGVVYFTVLCDHPYLVSLLFAVLVSLHAVTFSNVFLLLVPTYRVYRLYDETFRIEAIDTTFAVVGTSFDHNRARRH